MPAVSEHAHREQSVSKHPGQFDRSDSVGVFVGELNAVLRSLFQLRQVIRTPLLRLDGALWRPDITQRSPRRQSSTVLWVMDGHTIAWRITLQTVAGLSPLREPDEMLVRSLEAVRPLVSGEGH